MGARTSRHEGLGWCFRKGARRDGGKSVWEGGDVEGGEERGMDCLWKGRGEGEWGVLCACRWWMVWEDLGLVDGIAL